MTLLVLTNRNKNHKKIISQHYVWFGAVVWVFVENGQYYHGDYKHTKAKEHKKQTNHRYILTQVHLWQIKSNSHKKNSFQLRDCSKLFAREHSIPVVKLNQLLLAPDIYLTTLISYVFSFD